MSTVLTVVSLAALASAGVVLLTGYDIFYSTPVTGSAKTRAFLLWLGGAIIAWVLRGVV